MFTFINTSFANNCGSDIGSCIDSGCSEFGWCGTGLPYSSGNCVQQYSAPDFCTPLHDVQMTLYTVDSTDDTCGLKDVGLFYACLANSCCSKWGFCGLGSAWCNNFVNFVIKSPTSSTTIGSASASEMASAFMPLVTPIAQCINPKHVALTMDDGPSNDVTPQIFAQLVANNIPVTFFEIGKSMENNATGVAAMKAAITQHPDLFTLAVHTYHHWNGSDIMINPQLYNSGYDPASAIFENKADAAPYLGMSAAQVLTYELSRTFDMIVSSYGVQPNFFRPPYGEVNFGAMDVFNAFKLSSVVWSIGFLN